MVKFNKISLLCLGLLLVCGFGSAAYGQRTVTGVVQDENGEGLTGAVVAVRNSDTSTFAAVDGSFSLTVPSDRVVLVISCPGFDNREEAVAAGVGNIVVTLTAKSAMIEEVVVMGVSQTRRINVTGAVGRVSGSEILAIPVANVTNALVGNAPGVTGLQTSGEPGHNSTDIKIRGISTYASSAPLVVIDGVEQASERAFDQINAMDANEIASISILKDAASTAVYGIRGANGVIIVTTKRGAAGAPRISFSANFGVTQASQLQKGTTAYEYALMRNEAVFNEIYGFPGNESLLARVYDDYDLWKFKNNRDFTPQEVNAMTHLTAEQKEQLKNSPAVYYQSRDLYKEQFNKVAPQWNLNFNINGGTEKVKYFVSLGYFQQEGISTATKYYAADTRSNYQRYNYRTNFDIDITRNLRLSINSAGQFGQSKGPGASENPWDLNARYKVIMQYIYDANPFISPGIIDGRLVSGFAGEGGSVQNPLSQKTASTIGNQNALLNLINAGMNTIYNSMLDNSVRLEHKMNYLLEGLKVRGSVSYQDNYNRRTQFYPSVPTYTVQRNLDNPNVLEFFGGSMGGNSFNSTGYGNWNKLYLDGVVEWGGNFEGHDIQALVLGKASRYTMPGDNSNVPSGIIGFSARVAYNYKDRYMLEFNAGYNGTEQFESRYGFFPAFSAGWVPTEETFFPKNDILTYLKLRASYGEVGNDQLGGRRFLFLPSTYNYNNTTYWFGGNTGTNANTGYIGSGEGALGYPSIAWERAKKYDIGIEFQMLRGRLSVEADWFSENRSNILATIDGITPATYGVSSGNMTPANVGKTENHGFEVAMNWSDTAGSFRYEIGGDVSYSKNKIVYRAEAIQPYHWMNASGFSIGQRFGYISDGLYNTVEELANRPYHKFCSDRVTVGDIRYRDLNGDGVIDESDQAPIGYPNLAQFIYNFKLKLNWKGFDMNMLFTGTARGSYYLSTGYTIPFYKTAGNAWKWQYDGRWTPEKAANGAEITYPRASINASVNDNNFVRSDFWMMSSDFFKLKNIELGYTFHAKHMKARVFVSTNNVATFGAKRLREIGIDPELKDGSSYIYPLTKIYNLGINLQF